MGSSQWERETPLMDLGMQRRVHLRPLQQRGLHSGVGDRRVVAEHIAVDAPRLLNREIPRGRSTLDRTGPPRETKLRFFVFLNLTAKGSSNCYYFCIKDFGDFQLQLLAMTSNHGSADDAASRVPSQACAPSVGTTAGEFFKKIKTGSVRESLEKMASGQASGAWAADPESISASDTSAFGRSSQVAPWGSSTTTACSARCSPWATGCS